MKVFRKIFIFPLILFFISCEPLFSEEIRKPAVAGGFYPQGRDELIKMIDLFLDDAEKIDVDGRLIALISPHAGYVYSGHVAAHSFKQLEGEEIDTVVLICNSHTAYFNGIAIDASDMWETPLGSIKVNKEFAEKLINRDYAIEFNSTAHKRDHSLEVEMPFLQRVLKKDFKIVPILFGDATEDSYKKLAEVLARNLGEKDIIIISTDMSHYPSYKDANRIDKETLEMIETKDVSQLTGHIKDTVRENVPGEATLLCGIDGVKTIMEISNILGAEFKILKYANSGDVEIGDKSKVVGYGSAVIYIPSKAKHRGGISMKKEEYLNKEEKKKLIAIARASLLEAVTGKRGPAIEVTEETLKEKCGAFVTLEKHGELRGCIGYIDAVKPLYETVRDVAASAALNDYRFPPVRESELKDIEVEISVLTPRKKISNVEEIEVGKHGIVMKRGFNSGLLLPQVATDYGWDRNTFLEHTCMKAGLPSDAWKDPTTEIYIFQAEVFNEKELE